MVKRTERLQGSKERRDDEYYTLFQDIADEVSHYLPQLRGKSILCPWDWKESYDEKSSIKRNTMILGIVGNRRVDPKRRVPQDDKDHLLSEMTPDANGLYECAICHQHFAPNELEVDHKTPWSFGGRTVLSNAQLLCSVCNSSKGNK